ncbi:MAG TPA: hypothetical protein P5567_04425 [Kiritimatiellia bacterium]|nr:hypothetical protein [Kiritimatiellia bacterium]HRZ11684.1 hypothetical protein [Kiritimatiellia bacterium]HSA16765.1 hypothetical protein [Kiritimatiellia bacterium]
MKKRPTSRRRSRAKKPADRVVLSRAEYEALLRDARAKAVYDEIAAYLLNGIETLLNDESPPAP